MSFIEVIADVAYGIGLVIVPALIVAVRHNAARASRGLRRSDQIKTNFRSSDGRGANHEPPSIERDSVHNGNAVIRE
jgi:hypothetical protein